MTSSGDERSSATVGEPGTPDESDESDDRQDERRSRGGAEERPTTVRGWLSWFWNADRGGALVAREVLTSVGAVVLIGLILFSISGVWPPMVAVESGSMHPNMQVNDLVFITAPDRFAADAAIAGTGVVPHDRAEEAGYTKFNGYGDVIVFQPNGNGYRTPIIHRAMLWVEEGENWYDRADPEHVGGADDCDQLRNCPAPHDGFVTLGDNNRGYDQIQGQQPVKPEWVIGTAEIRVPYLGWVRLRLAEIGATSVVQVERVDTVYMAATAPEPSTPPGNESARAGSAAAA